MALTHRIRRQVLELALPREGGAARRAQETAGWFRERVLPRLDAVFSRIAPEGRIVRIRRIEIDLGTIPEERYEEEFIERCVRQIVQQVEAAAYEVGPDGKPGSAELADPDANAVAILRFFLQQGFLPWYAAGLALPELEKQVATAMKNSPALLRAGWLRTALQQRAIAQRLVWQFRWDFILQLLEAVAGLRAGSAGRYLKKSGQTTAGFSAGQKAAFIAAAAQLSDRHTGETLLKAAGTAAFSRQTAPYMDPTPEASQPKAKPDAVPAEAKRAEAGDAKQAEDGEAPPISAERAPAPHAEGIAVVHAGLVLLGPYLPRFFEALDINIDPARPETAYRALHLLHHLAGGAPNPEEPALVAPKVLCGLLPEEPAPQEFTLSATDYEECRHLLEAVIRNWPALKNTGPDGLRGAFLQRAGLLYWEEERRSWLLRIERQSHDLLLERLPWSYTVLKFDWMDWMIRVEW